MAPIVGSAEVLIRPSFKNMQKGARKAGVEAGRNTGRSFTSQMGQQVTKWAKRGLLAAGVTTGAVFVGGVKSALSQQASTLVLTGLYDNAELAKSTMESLNEVARKSPLGADAFRRGAESLAYAGIQGDSAVKALENVGKTIVGAGGTAEQVDQFSNALINGVNRGKFGLNELNQISKAGVPIFSSLAEEMGLTAEEVTALASDGKIGLEEVMSVLENADTDAFQQSIKAGEEAQKSFGNTAKTLWNDITVALGDHLQPVLEWATDKFRELAEKVGPKLDAFLEKATSTVKEFIQQWRDGEGVGGKFRSVLEGVGDAFRTAFTFVTDTVVPALKATWEWLKENEAWLLPVAAGVGAIVAAWKTYQTGLAIARGVTAAFTAVQAALNVVLSANPVALIVIAIAGLVAALVTAYKRSETFREVVDKVWTGIKNAASVVVDWFMETALPVLQDVWDGIVTGATWMWEHVLEPMWEGMKVAWEVVSTAISWYWEYYIKPAWETLAAVATWLWETVLAPAWEGIKVAWEALSTGIEWAWEHIIEPAWEGMAAVATWLYETILEPVFNWIEDHWEEIAFAINYAWEEHIKPAWEAVATTATWLWDNVLKPTFKYVTQGWNVLAFAIGWAWENVIEPAWDAISTTIGWLWRNILKPAFTNIGRAWTTMSETIQKAWRWIDEKVIQPFGRGIKNLRGTVNTQVENIQRKWEGIKSAFAKPWNWVKENVFDRFKKGLTNLRNHVRTMRDSIGNAWRSVANRFRNPINWVLDKVWNNGIAKAFNKAAGVLNLKTRISTEAQIPKFAKGGLARKGWALVGEEGPELVNFSNPGRVYTASETADALSLTNTPDAANHTDSLPMGGGIGSRLWEGAKEAGSAVAGWARGGLAKAADLILSPIRKIISPTVKQWGTFGNFAGGAMTKSLDSLVDWIRGKDKEDAAKGIGTLAKDMAGGKWRRPSSGRITSHYGPRSLLGMNFHAGTDFAGGRTTHAAGAGRVFRVGTGILGGRSGVGIGIDHGGGTFTYYGHNPYGGPRVKPGDQVRAGQHIGYEGATGNVTGPHLHFELHRGGWGRHVNPRQLGVFDQGGLLHPGMMAYHSAHMSKPDVVLTSRQWDAIHSLAAGGGGGDVYNVDLNVDLSQIDSLAKAERFFSDLPRLARQKAGVR